MVEVLRVITTTITTSTSNATTNPTAEYILGDLLEMVILAVSIGSIIVIVVVVVLVLKRRT